MWRINTPCFKEQPFVRRIVENVWVFNVDEVKNMAGLSYLSGTVSNVMTAFYNLKRFLCGHFSACLE